MRKLLYSRASKAPLLEGLGRLKRYQEANNTAAVDMLLDYFPSNNIIDDNYFVYYNWINQMQKDPNYKPQLDEVLHLANQCPDTYGSVVYDAQNLYMQLINDIYYFDNNCESQPATAARKVDVTKIKRVVKTEKINSGIEVYPNPSNGIINIKLPLLLKGDYNVTITDILGKQLVNKTIKEGSINSQINIPIKGICFLNVKNTITGKQQVTKIVIN
jgi:Secretion system C-terminal sorting domain